MSMRADLAMLVTVLTVPIRQLGEPERAAVERLLDRDPYAGAQVAERVARARAELVALRRADLRLRAAPRARVALLVGRNLMPVLRHARRGRGVRRPARRPSRACARRSSAAPTRCSTCGSAWAALGPGPRRPAAPAAAGRGHAARRRRPTRRYAWSGRTRSTRSSRPRWRCTPRRSASRRWSTTAGAATGERIAELVSARRAYARFVDERVVFKAELAIVTRRTAQVQGVWVRPECRGEGSRSGGMAAVVHDALRRVAPTVSLYVNDYNAPAGRTPDAVSAQGDLRDRPVLAEQDD